MLSSSADATHSVRSWSSEHLPGVEVSLREHAGPPPPFRLIPMVQLKVLLAGEAELRSGNDSWRETPGGCMVIPPDRGFQVVRRLSETASTLRACIAPRVIDDWMRRHGGPSVAVFQLRHFENPEMGAALSELLDGMRDGANAAALRSSFDRLMRAARASLKALEAARAPDARPEIRKAMEILQERFALPLSLDELTNYVGLSKFHLIRLFRDHVGVAPHAFQLQLRVSRARELLTSGASVADVAAACGFADQSHFSRCFKSAVGYTPRTFQRLH